MLGNLINKLFKRNVPGSFGILKKATIGIVANMQANIAIELLVKKRDKNYAFSE